MASRGFCRGREVALHARPSRPSDKDSGSKSEDSYVAEGHCDHAKAHVRHGTASPAILSCKATRAAHLQRRKLALHRGNDGRSADLHMRCKRNV